MEHFIVQAQHSGAINHAHSFSFPPTAVHFAKEIRITITIVAVAWVTVKALDLWKRERE